MALLLGRQVHDDAAAQYWFSRSALWRSQSAPVLVALSLSALVVVVVTGGSAVMVCSLVFVAVVSSASTIVNHRIRRFVRRR